MINAYRKQWINTKVEYQWSDELGELVEISKEGYWYEGEMSLCTTDRTVDDGGWGYHDTNTNGSSNHPHMYYMHGGGYGLHLNSPAATSSTYLLELHGATSNRFYVGGTGLVGIGTNSPSQLLHLKTTGSLDTTMVLEGGNSTWSIGTDNSDSGYLKISNNATAGTSTSMTFGASGKIGIGTNAPDTLLHLKSSPDYAPELKIEHTGGHNNGGLLMRSTGTAANGDRLGHIQFDGLNSASENIRYAEIGGFIDDVADSSEDGKITFSTYVAGTHAERMTIKGGNVGIGDTTPSYKLEVAGTFYASGSSIEYKEDVEPYTPPEGALMGLKPVQYQYKDAWKDFGKRYSGNSSRQIGFVAEDVAKILPELAVTKSEDGKEVVRNVDYEKLTVLLVSEVQSLRKEVNDLRTSR